MGFLTKAEARAQEEIVTTPESNSTSSDKPKTEKNTYNDQDTSPKEWGYDLYPERRSEGFKPKWSRVLLGLEGHENIDKLKCERNVYWCAKNSPLVKLMMGALKSSGCPIDLRRHISCEVCDTTVTGGYDPVLNQIVNCVKTKALASVLAVRNVSRQAAIEAVERVFPKCYNDLEPIGRRIRRNSPDQHRAYMEGPMYGYDVY
uniref:Mitochondrial inner membrane protease ATP23 n=1 Tax=Glossina pallidipes TaxID=7398 RepID=A0A1B0ABC0_GLOPL